MIALAVAALLSAVSAAPTAPPRGTAEEKIRVPLFGEVSVYRPEPVQRARGVILFVSGDGGWNLGVVDMARRSAPRAIVVGLSMRAWQKAAEKSLGRCWYPAGELESIAQAVEKTYRLPRYVPPVLVGYSSGATVVYGVLAQAPDGTFAGAVSLGFCPDLEVARPLCGRESFKPEYDPKKRRSLLPARPDLGANPRGGPAWIALQGDIDQVCDPAGTRRFVEQIPAAKLVWLLKVGHGFSVPRRWGAEYDAAVESLLDPSGPWAEPPRRVPASPPPEEIGRRLEALGLPLEVEWPEGAQEAIVFVSGDGGWAELDREVSAALVARGIAVVGWNSLRYFWSAKTPETFRADLARVVAALPDDVRLFAGGYSFGAEVVPAALAPGGADLPAPLGRIGGLVLLAPGPFATFEVSPLDWIRTDDRASPYPVRGPLETGIGRPVLCLEPSSGEDSGCPSKPGPGVRRESLPGGHHFGGEFAALAGRMLEFLRARPSDRQ
jgi:type IV secretory pathway VirJ component